MRFGQFSEPHDCSGLPSKNQRNDGARPGGVFTHYVVGSRLKPSAKQSTKNPASRRRTGCNWRSPKRQRRDKTSSAGPIPAARMGGAGQRCRKTTATAKGASTRVAELPLKGRHLRTRRQVRRAQHIDNCLHVVVFDLLARVGNERTHDRPTGISESALMRSIRLSGSGSRDSPIWKTTVSLSLDKPFALR